ncbi:MAG TPA: antibiotic biosynthesis monooxygenase [Gemmatimonadales bacterium]|nr:antibiotic biosynthesis monooxygenase [Gemmatimonadales bacterium]
MYVVRWAFRAREERRAEFLESYGPRGAWAQLFERGEGFLGTELAPEGGTGRWITTDRWQSRQAFEAFRSRFASEYHALDARTADLTTEELRLDEFESP